MSPAQRQGRGAAAGREPAESDPPDGDEHGDSEELGASGLGALLQDRRKLASAVLVFVAGVVGVYLVLPKVVGIDESLDRLSQASPYWIAIAVAFNFAAFAAYVALFRGILGGSGVDDVRRRLDVRASYQITMAGLAATRIFSAAGAGGIVLTYWALRKAGMSQRLSGCRMVAFLVLLYSIYLLALIVFGVLLRTGVLPGDDPVGGTLVPAAIAAVAIAILGLVALIPGDFERRLREFARGYRRARFAARIARGPATIATGVRTAIDYLRHPSRGALAVTGAAGFWAANIGVLWASFEAFGGDVPFAVLVQGFFVGMAANLVPSPAGGVGSVDAGMIGAFVLFGIPSGVVFPAVLVYRVIAFWLPIPPGLVAYFQLRRTVARWEEERGVYASESKVTAEAT
ncbi:MAG: flippase-like domain-containing protein [Thermoleophilaceae bacterium]|nr:flippase-like domain-containing protein [Thermoleophilaceae bacterium]